MAGGGGGGGWFRWWGIMTPNVTLALQPVSYFYESLMTILYVHKSHFLVFCSMMVENANKGGSLMRYK